MLEATSTLTSRAAESSAIPPFVVPIIQAFVAQISPLFAVAMEMTALTTMCTFILITVLYFSTPPSRATFMWKLVVAEITFGMGLGIWGMYTFVSDVDPPLESYEYSVLCR
jgi:hypothetical protein